jgi:hypothetical protein
MNIQSLHFIHISTLPKILLLLILFILVLLSLSTVKCSVTSFNAFIDHLPNDHYFIKIFFDEIRSQDLQETRIPVMIQRFYHWPFGSEEYHDQFSHVKRLIGSRTNGKVLNVVQVNFKKMYSSYKLDLEVKIDTRNSILHLTTGFFFPYRGTNTYTIILGNSNQYDLLSQHPYSFAHQLKLDNPFFLENVVFVFNFQRRYSMWRICGVPHEERSALLPSCINSLRINEELLDFGMIVGRTWGVEKFIKPISNGNPLENPHSFFHKPSHQILADEIMHRSNESYCNCKSKYDTSFRIDLKSDLFLYDLMDTFVVIDEYETNFLSCYSAPVLKFEMYVNPFELELWIAIGSLLATIVLFIYSYNRSENLSPSFSSFFFFVSILLEESYSVPTALWRDSKFKAVTIVWLLTAFIFTNLYTGQMITDLSFPLRDPALYSFEEIFAVHSNTTANRFFLSNIYYYNDFWSSYKNEWYLLNDMSCRFDVKYNDYDTHLQQFRKKDHLALLQTPSSVCENVDYTPTSQQKRLALPQMYSIFNQLQSAKGYFYYKDNIKMFHPTYVLCVLKFFSPEYRHYPKDPNFQDLDEYEDIKENYMDVAIEKEIVACGKSIFIAEVKDLRAELRYLSDNYPQKSFYVGNHTMEMGQKRKLRWEFRNPGTSKVPYYLKLLLQAGIRYAIIRIQNHRKYLRRRKGTQLIKELEVSNILVNMQGSIQTIFIISIAVISLGCLAFLAELVYQRKYRMYMFLLHLAVKFLICPIKARIITRYCLCLRFGIRLPPPAVRKINVVSLS